MSFIVTIGVILGLEFLVVVALGVWLLLAWLKYQEREPDFMAGNYLNLTPFGEYAWGIERKVKILPGGKTKIIVSPKDYILKDKKAKPPLDEEIILDKGYRVCIPRGNLSKVKPLAIYLPRDLHEVPEAVLEAIKGSWLDKIINNKIDWSKREKAFIVHTNNLQEAILRILKEHEGGEISELFIANTKEMMQEQIKIFMREQAKDIRAREEKNA